MIKSVLRKTLPFARINDRIISLQGRLWRLFPGLQVRLKMLEQTLSVLEEQLAASLQALARLEELARAQQDSIEEQQRTLAEIQARQAVASGLCAARFAARLRLSGEAGARLAGVRRVLAARRESDLIVLPVEGQEAGPVNLAGHAPRNLIEGVLAGELHKAVILGGGSGRGTALTGGEWLISAILDAPAEALAWLDAKQPERAARSLHLAPVTPNYFKRLREIAEDLPRLDFYALGSTGPEGGAPQPFDIPASLPRYAPAEPRRRSAVFLHNNYYHFNVLAAGLKQRGWDTMTVSLESPDSPQQQFYHGQDVNLYDPDPAVMADQVRAFFRGVPERFGSLHFYSMGQPSFFPAHFENGSDPERIPWDFLELRRHGIVIGYMPSGCLDGGAQSSIKALSGVCRRCVWELRPDVCNDAKSLAWNRKLAALCDWVGIECDYATPERVSDRTVYGPVVTTLDPDRWHPELEVPDDMRLARQPEDILIYHAVGNYALRRQAGRDIKGTGAVLQAVERLKGEGLPVQLIFAHDVPSTRVRFLQVQADIVVDQLNYGRYGANSREALMLGKPTICHLNPAQAPAAPPLRPILEAPLISAEEDSVYTILRDLVLDRDRRTAIGRKSREFALAWHGQEACAARYERVIDRIRAGLPADAPELYPPGPVDADPRRAELAPGALAP